MSKVKELLAVQHFHAEVIDDEQVSLCEFGEEAVCRACDPGQCQLLEEPVEVEVGDPEAVHASLMAKCGAEPALSGAGGPGDEYGDASWHIVACGEVQYGLFVHAPRPVIYYVGQGGLVAEACVLHPSSHLA